MAKHSLTTTIGAFDAKNRLSGLLDRVESGEILVSTRHGEPVARLVPYDAEIDKKSVQHAIDGLLATRKGVTLGDLELRQRIAEGRR